MSRPSKNSVVVLLLVFVSVLLISLVVAAQAVAKESKKTNIDKGGTFLDPFSLAVKSASKNGKKVIIRSHYWDIILPDNARPRSPFVPGKPG